MVYNLTPAVSGAEVFGPLHMLLAGRFGPRSEMRPKCATNDSTHLPSARRPTAGPSDSGLWRNTGHLEILTDDLF